MPTNLHNPALPEHSLNPPATLPIHQHGLHARHKRSIEQNLKPFISHHLKSNTTFDESKKTNQRGSEMLACCLCNHKWVASIVLFDFTCVSLFLIQSFAESLQQDSSNQSEIVMIKLYCCGPDYCSRYPLLLPNKERSWVFGLQALLQRFCKTLYQ